VLETEQLMRKAETLPKALFQEAAHCIGYLSPKAQSAYFAEKLAEAEREANQPEPWLDENDFWNEDDGNMRFVSRPLPRKTVLAFAMRVLAASALSVLAALSACIPLERALGGAISAFAT